MVWLLEADVPDIGGGGLGLASVATCARDLMISEVADVETDVGPLDGAA